MDIAQLLKDVRRQQHWEQEDLAKRLDTSQQTVSNWENGTLPRAGALRRINELLGELKLPPVSVSTIAKIEIRREEEVFEQLSPALGYQREAVIQYQGVKLRVDYMTPRVVAEFKNYHSHTGETTFLQNAIFQLDTVRKVQTLHGAAREIYTLILMSQQPVENPVAYNRLMTLGALHDVQVFLAQNAKQVADILQNLETETV